MRFKRSISGTFLILSSGPLQFVGATLAILLASYVEQGELNLTVWIGLFFISLVLMSLGLISSSITFGIAAFFWGWQTFPLLFLSYMISSYFGYWIGNKLGLDLIEIIEKKHPKIANVIGSLKTSTFFDVFMIRISPVLPFSMVNYVMGATRINLTKFMIAGTAGMAPRAALAFLLGSYAKTLKQVLEGGAMTSEQQYTLISATVITLGYLIYRFLWPKNKKASSTESE